MLTDPPYGIGFQHSGISYGLGGKSKTDTIVGDDSPFDPAFLLAISAMLCLWGADHYASRLPEGSWIVWDKLGGRHSFNDSFSDCEVAWLNRKGKMRIFRHLWKGLLKEGEGRGESRVHVSQKPIELMRYCLTLFPDSQSILDPFMALRPRSLAARKVVPLPPSESKSRKGIARLQRAVSARKFYHFQPHNRI